MIKILVPSNLIPHQIHRLGAPRMRVLTDNRLLVFIADSADTREEISDHPVKPGWDERGPGLRGGHPV